MRPPKFLLINSLGWLERWLPDGPPGVTMHPRRELCALGATQGRLWWESAITHSNIFPLAFSRHQVNLLPNLYVTNDCIVCN